MAGFLRVALMVGLATLAGCLSNPVGETLREPDEARIEDRRSALDSDRPSDATVELLESLGIFDWDRNPYDLIDRLGKAGEFSAGAVSPWRLKLAEAEIAYWIAARHKRLDDVSQNHYLIAARAALEGMEIRGRLGAFNPRERLLLDLHNGGLTRYLEVTQERWGHPRDWEERARAEGLPRPIVISGTGTHQLDQFDSFVAADRLRIDGVRRRQRQFGLGAAIIAVFEN
ncbi:MAG: hypothetical protein KDB53_16565, partial [Planctomycetes bacterium]|nr:hypothetical protein [Planctomycetota bacterium]